MWYIPIILLKLGSNGNNMQCSSLLSLYCTKMDDCIRCRGDVCWPRTFLKALNKGIIQFDDLKFNDSILFFWLYELNDLIIILIAKGRIYCNSISMPCGGIYGRSCVSLQAPWRSREKLLHGCTWYIYLCSWLYYFICLFIIWKMTNIYLSNI